MDCCPLPHSPELATILPHIIPKSIDRVVVPLARILGAIRPLIYAIALLFPKHKLPMIFGTAMPHLNTMTMLHVLPPLSLICRQAILVEVCPKALCQVCPPLTNKNITICMQESPIA